MQSAGDPILKRFRAALADLSTEILDEAGEFIHAMPYRASSYEERTPLMHEIRTGGIGL
jgi:uncharacterized protein